MQGSCNHDGHGVRETEEVAHRQRERHEPSAARRSESGLQPGRKDAHDADMDGHCAEGSVRVSAETHRRDRKRACGRSGGARARASEGVFVLPDVVVHRHSHGVRRARVHPSAGGLAPAAGSHYPGGGDGDVRGRSVAAGPGRLRVCFLKGLNGTEEKVAR